MSRRAAALLVSLVGLAAASGCGRAAVLDVEQAEAAIREQLSEAYEVDVASVACEDDVEVEAGGEFPCRALVGDAVVSVTVRQSDEDGTLEVASEQAILSTAAVEADIAATLAERFERDEVEVACDGPAERLEEPGATFACEAVDGDDTTLVTVRVRDARGSLTYSLSED